MIDVSATHGTGIDVLEKAVRKLFIDEKVIASSDAVFTNARQIGKVKEAYLAISSALSGCRAGMSMDAIEIDIRASWESLGEITHIGGSDALIENIFSRFCIGK
jgi:tRNA modification GTPase